MTPPSPPLGSCGGATTHPPGSRTATRAFAARSPEPIEWYVGEALTNLYVGLHRDRRGERLSGMRLIQVHAVDRLIGLLDPLGRAGAARQDPFAVGTRASNGGSTRPSCRCMPSRPGYEHNREARSPCSACWKGSCPWTPGWRRRSATWLADVGCGSGTL